MLGMLGMEESRAGCSPGVCRGQEGSLPPGQLPHADGPVWIVSAAQQAHTVGGWGQQGEEPAALLAFLCAHGAVNGRESGALEQPRLGAERFAPFQFTEAVKDVIDESLLQQPSLPEMLSFSVRSVYLRKR